MKWTPQHEVVFMQVVKILRPPKFAINSMRNKYKRIGWSVEQIEKERYYFEKLASKVTDPHFWDGER